MKRAYLAIAIVLGVGVVAGAKGSGIIGLGAVAGGQGSGAIGLGAVANAQGSGAVGLGAVAGAQASGAVGLGDVVAELRALRADLNHTSSVTIRTQLLVARLQLQEQRIVSLSRQLSEAQNALDAVANGNVATIEQLKRREAQLPQLSGEDRVQVEAELRHMKPIVEQSQRREQALRLQATELLNMLSTEQSRWTDFNERIDALERSLPSK